MDADKDRQTGIAIYNAMHAGTSPAGVQDGCPFRKQSLIVPAFPLQIHRLTPSTHAQQAVSLCQNSEVSKLSMRKHQPLEQQDPKLEM